MTADITNSGVSKLTQALYLSLATVGLLLTVHPVFDVAAVWLAAFFSARFIWTMDGHKGFLLLTLFSSVAFYFTLDGVVPIPTVELIITAIISALFNTLIFSLDKWICRTLPFVLKPLVLPVLMVSLLYMANVSNPFGTWGDPAYAQLKIPTFAQLAAVTGIWGISFLIFWIVSIVNQLWQANFKSQAFIPLGGTVVLCVLITVGYGMMRPDSKSTSNVKLATVTHGGNSTSVFRKCNRDDFYCYSKTASLRVEQLLAHSQSAAAQGAQLILWSEGAAEILESQYTSLEQRLSEFAQRNRIYLVAGVTQIPEQNGVFENKLVAIAPSGKVLFTYHKSKPVPGEPIVAGNNLLPVIDTPFGRISALICFDADFTQLAQQAGNQGADLLLNAANDWPAIADIHADMSVMRGIENGFSVLRAASNGWSYFSTPEGEVLSRSAHHLDQNAQLMVFDAPIKSINTLYQLHGDWLAMVCLWASLTVIGYTLFRKLPRFRLSGKSRKEAEES